MEKIQDLTQDLSHKKFRSWVLDFRRSWVKSWKKTQDLTQDLVQKISWSWVWSWVLDFRRSWAKSWKKIQDLIQDQDPRPYPRPHLNMSDGHL